ncbi:MAG: hypothetical protein CM1200mP22_06580 [Dehalococcoidia bacterium]|nr:MAG: hypothetical protein CM1200mP22_06580 [Dehalococcoidia bacterium]
MPHHDRDPDVGGYLRSFATTDLTYWPSALKSGARLETHARVREITINESGNATGALYYQEGQLKEQKAKAVVLACNGVGTARLLLNSTSPLYPNGLANRADSSVNV